MTTILVIYLNLYFNIIHLAWTATSDRNRLSQFRESEEVRSR